MRAGGHILLCVSIYKCVNAQLCGYVVSAHISVCVCVCGCEPKCARGKNVDTRVFESVHMRVYDVWDCDYECEYGCVNLFCVSTGVCNQVIIKCVNVRVSA